MTCILNMIFRILQQKSVIIDRYCHCYGLKHVTLDSSVGRAEDCSRKVWAECLGHWFESSSRDFLLLNIVKTRLLLKY